MSALDVEHLDNGDVRLSRKYPARQAGCATVRLRLTAAEWSEWLTEAKAGDFDGPDTQNAPEITGAMSGTRRQANPERGSAAKPGPRNTTENPTPTDLRKKANR